MATFRTPEERAAIAARCIELEKEGGDILGYLWSENYLTPRATWCNIQREWLGRKPYEFTDGKPGKKRKERKKVENRRENITDEQRAEAVRIALDGGDPREYLEGLGFADGQTTWYRIKKHYKDKAPDVYAQIPKRIPVNGLKNKAAKKAETEKAEPETVLGRPKTDFEPATVKVDGPLKIETPEGTTIKVAELPEIIDGVTKEITVHEADMFEVPEGMVPLHMLKHPVKVNIVKDEPKITKPPVTKPVVYDGMIIREVEGAFGRYRYSDIGTVEYIDFESTDQMDVLSLSIGQWRNFREEQRKAARILGVEL